MTAISIKNISKKYLVGKQKDGSLRGTLSGFFQSNKHTTEEFYALKDVSFDVMQGDVVGIIGKNGAGKSTLLKILSQITKPSSGRIELNGRVASLLEVGTGFHPELTGRENVFLNGTILGMTRKEVALKFDEIVAFSGVEKFIDTPVKHYSSGMYVRLAFAVAAHLEPEILIIDEVLAVGDAEFQKKCLGKMKDVAGEGRTVLFVSHDLGAVKQLCNKGVLLEKGRVSINGSMQSVLNAYVETQRGFELNFMNSNVDFDKDYDIESIFIKNSAGKNQNQFHINEAIHFEMNFHIKPNASLYSMYLCVNRYDGQRVFSIDKKISNQKHHFTIEPNCLTRGIYSLQIFIQVPQKYKLVEYANICTFEVIDLDSELSVHGDYDYGSTFGKYSWI